MAKEKICVAHVCATTFSFDSLSCRLRHLIDFTSIDIQIELIDLIYDVQVRKLHRDKYSEFVCAAVHWGGKTVGDGGDEAESETLGSAVHSSSVNKISRS